MRSPVRAETRSWRGQAAAVLIAVVCLAMGGWITASGQSSSSAPLVITDPSIPPEFTQYPCDWPTANKDYANTRATHCSPIESANVDRLKMIWSYELTAGGASTPIILGDTVFYQDLNSNLVALTLADGSVRWHKKIDRPVLGPNGVAAGWGNLFAAKGYYDFAAFDQETGDELWSVTLSDRATVGVLIQPAVYDGRVYLSTVAGGTQKPDPGGGIGALYALDQASGDIAWELSTVDSPGIWGNPTVNYGGGSYQTPAIDPSTGQTFWGISNAAPSPGTPAYPNGSSRPGPNLFTNSMLAVDHLSGRLEWFRQVYPHDLFNYGLSIPPILAAATIDGQEQRIVVGAGKTGKVYAFSQDTGALLWEVAVGRHENDQLARLPQGTTRVYPGGEGGVETPMAYADGIVYVSVIDMYADYTPSSMTPQNPAEARGSLVAIETSSGKILWDHPLDSMNVGAATVVNDLVFTATLSGDILALSRTNGEPVWSYQASPGVTGWPAVAGDTIVFLAAVDGAPSLVAFKLDPPSPSGLTNAGSPEAAALKNGSSSTPLQTPSLSIQLEPWVSGLTAPTAFAAPADGTERQFIAEQTGQVRVVHVTNGSPQLMSAPLLDIRDKMIPLNPQYDERGLLGLALHPQFADNGYVYVFYTIPPRPHAPAGYDHTNRVSRFTIDPSNPDQVSPGSELLILEYDVPNSGPNAGALAFGPDGYLYISTGDGKSGGQGSFDGFGTGQDLSRLLGMVLRIDVDKGSADYPNYSIPPTNPFAHGAPELNRPEIYAYGFRDPAGMSFDAQGRSLFVTDDGVDLFDGINLVVREGNYGWNLREGTHCFASKTPDDPPTSCAIRGGRGEPLIGPIVESGNNLGVAAIGGYVYRGKAVPSLAGLFVFGNWSTQETSPDGRLFAASPPSGAIAAPPDSFRQLTAADLAMWHTREMAVASKSDGHLHAYIRAFGEDASRELYVLTSQNAGPTGTTGTVMRIASPS